MSNCCDFGCDGSPGCIAGQSRETAAEPNWWPVLDKLPAPNYCERAKQPCTTPYTCNPLCRLIDSQLPIQMFEPPRWYQRPAVLWLAAQVGASIGFGLWFFLYLN